MKKHKILLLIIFSFFIFFLLSYFFQSRKIIEEYSRGSRDKNFSLNDLMLIEGEQIQELNNRNNQISNNQIEEINEINNQDYLTDFRETKIFHLETPEKVRAVYFTGYALGTPSYLERLNKILNEKEINSVVIDIKDWSGLISFNFNNLDKNSKIKEIGAEREKIKNIVELIKELHEKNIYVIGRICVFQDKFLVSKRPDLAVRKRSNQDEIWKDKKGITWIDPGVKENWDYIIEIARKSYELGFDEINFDYIRFPSDGNMKDIYFVYSERKEKREVLKNFFSYLNSELRDLREKGLKISIDIFGMVASEDSDLNIGQYLEDIAPFFDYIMPMVYPSHFPSGWRGFKNPAENPYEIIKISIGEAINRLEKINEPKEKIRPWFQDFNLGALYDVSKVKAQIQAVYDLGLNSWSLWDPKNKYTLDALESKAND